MDLASHYLEVSLDNFKRQKALAEKAMVQLADAELYKQPDPQSNSIAIIIKHLAGNMRSRWLDFLTTDGEKSDRNRDSEFVEPPEIRVDLLELWEKGWSYVFTAIESLSPSDLTTEVMIRDQSHTVVQAIERQIDHYAQHVGQIIYIARHLKGEQFTSLSIPKGESEKFIPESLKAKWAKL